MWQITKGFGLHLSGPQIEIHHEAIMPSLAIYGGATVHDLGT